MIGDEIELIILGVDGESVKLGFSAPKNVQIMREELYQGISQENASAAGINQGNKASLEQVLKNFKL